MYGYCATTRLMGSVRFLRHALLNRLDTVTMTRLIYFVRLRRHDSLQGSENKLISPMEVNVFPDKEVSQNENGCWSRTRDNTYPQLTAMSSFGTKL